MRRLPSVGKVVPTPPLTNPPLAKTAPRGNDSRARSSLPSTCPAVPRLAPQPAGHPARESDRSKPGVRHAHPRPKTVAPAGLRKKTRNSRDPIAGVQDPAPKLNLVDRNVPRGTVCQVEWSYPATKALEGMEGPATARAIVTILGMVRQLRFGGDHRGPYLRHDPCDGTPASIRNATSSKPSQST